MRSGPPCTRVSGGRFDEPGEEARVSARPRAPDAQRVVAQHRARVHPRRFCPIGLRIYGGSSARHSAAGQRQPSRSMWASRPRANSSSGKPARQRGAEALGGFQLHARSRGETRRRGGNGWASSIFSASDCMKHCTAYVCALPCQYSATPLARQGWRRCSLRPADARAALRPRRVPTCHVRRAPRCRARSAAVEEAATAL